MTVKSESELLNDLNEEQREAVLHLDGPLLILAGAGSGKTRVLTYRIALLIARRRAEPGNILAITFTNKAAEEMRNRIISLVGLRSGGIWMSTFHSCCSRILRREAERLGYRRNFAIYDDEDQLRMIGHIMRDMKVDTKRYHPRLVRSIVEGAKVDMIDVDAYRGQVHDELTEMASFVYGRYQEQLLRNNAMDFNDLLLNAIAVLELFPLVMDYYQNLFTYINVDEYQDTNPAQYKLVKLLSERHRNLCVVGDDDQGIYSWRGADLRNILEFEKDYSDSRVVRLERNYRSTGNILEAANHVVSLIPRRKEKRLWTDRGRGELIKYFRAYSGGEEAAYIVVEISRLMGEGGYGNRDIAIFYRTNAQSRAFEESLLRSGIPYKIVGGFKFYERKEVKDTLAYLKFLVNPDDSISLRRIVNEPKRGIGRMSLAHLDAYAGTQDISLWKAMLQAERVINLATAARRKVSEFVELMEGLRLEMDRDPLPALLKKILDRSGYTAAIVKEGTFEAEGRLENLEELKSTAAEYITTDPSEGIEGFLERVSLVSEIDLYDESEGAITLMTLHNAKGLEFPVVFIVGMEDGVFPHLRCMDSERGMEEERRLFYVGVTRARDLLYLTGAVYRSQYGDVKLNPESRFIRDIPRGYLQDVAATGGMEGMERGDGKRGGTELDMLASGFHVGDRVIHDKWGEGVVTALSRSRSGPEISVDFPGEGEKLLLLQYAPLRVLPGGRDNG
ncbi:MAG: UvrD-helicase domain-containing protein [Actinomycetota bacterium]|nr:UvrD-helicase domain-containing protein [Actinomycetota bacterium]